MSSRKNKRRAAADSSSSEQSDEEGSSSAASRSTSAASKRKQKPGDTFDNRNNRGRQVAGPNYGTVNLGNTNDNSQRTSHRFGDHASRMVNAPVTGDISFGDTHDNSQRTRYQQDNRGNLGNQITGGTFSGATFNQPIHHGAHTDNSVHAPSNQGFVAVGDNFGIQNAPQHGGTQHNQLAHRDINFGVAAGQQGPSQSKETKDTDGKTECYPLNTKPKGHMLIIANEIYQDGNDNDGALVDRHKIAALGRILGYDVKSSHENLTAEEMRKALKDFVEKIETEPHLDSAIIFVLAHGEPDEIIGVDGEAVERKEFFDAMKPDNCGALTGKPKLIFFDARRGNKHDPGAENKQKSGAPQEQAASETDKPYTLDERAIALAQYEIKKAKAYAEEQESGKEVKTKGPRLPIMSDMLIVDATAMDYYAYGSTSGSDFIDAIYDVFKSNHKTKSIDDMLHLVHEHVLKKMHGGMKEDACHVVEGTNYMSSLRKKFMFCPPSW
uniref:Uncharacterized protein n=1 Tax=Plectus sambesii TaxID=2011161 RepID=A0A914UWI6_9BILA